MRKPAKSPSASSSPSPPKSFEQAMAELDEIVAKMESGELPLDDMLSAYKRGAELVRFCRGKLDNAQAEIKKLDESGDDGGGGLMDFDGSKDG